MAHNGITELFVDLKLDGLIVNGHLSRQVVGLISVIKATAVRRKKASEGGLRVTALTQKGFSMSEGGVF